MAFAPSTTRIGELAITCYAEPTLRCSVAMGKTRASFFWLVDFNGPPFPPRKKKEIRKQPPQNRNIKRAPIAGGPEENTCRTTSPNPRPIPPPSSRSPRQRAPTREPSDGRRPPPGPPSAADCGSSGPPRRRRHCCRWLGRHSRGGRPVKRRDWV